MADPALAAGALDAIRALYLDPCTISTLSDPLQRLRLHPPLFARQLDPAGLVRLEPGDPKSTIEVKRDAASPVHVSFAEVDLANPNETAANSSSTLRRPDPNTAYVKGSVANYPFAPGGFDLPPARPREPCPVSEDELRFDPASLLCCPPGFERGIDFSATAAPAREPERGAGGPSKNALAHYTPGELEQAFAHGLASVVPAPLPVKDLFKGGDDDLLLGEEEEDDEEEKPAPAPPPSTVPPAAAAFAGAGFDAKGPDLGPLDDDGADDLDAVLSPIASLLASRNAGKAPGPGGKKGEEVWAITERIDTSRFKELVPEPAIRHPFELDPFQKEAVLHMERGDSVFAAAHTSAGKTVVAEYAIALAQRHCTRAIYTSPIKTLSNQKFREFKKVFSEVGILTGDVSVNPAAPCLIMTTEILRSMLYKGADLIRDVEWVIFDEVHYVNDIERGVVWEEVIIMLPPHVNLVMLSATVPNVAEFADWIGRTKRKPIHVVSTRVRPVPLEHFLSYSGELYKIVDSKGTFLNVNHRAAVAVAKEKQKGRGAYGAPGGRGGAGGARQDKTQWRGTVEMLRKKSLLPVIVFSFSKKRCELAASGLGGLDLSTGTEKSEVHVFVANSLTRLRGTDRELPQILRVKELLKRGIGVHHAGLLPIVKEVVEMLFQRGLVKVLFATETFAMGVNMPARTVVFNGVRKHDGRGFRDLLPGEYAQMSGRAGRRGLDSTGVVIIACWDDSVPEELSTQKLVSGQATKLESQFRLTYNMILNLLRVEDMRVEDMIKRSFSEFHLQRGSAALAAARARGEDRLASLPQIACVDPACAAEAESYAAALLRSASLGAALLEALAKSRAASALFCPGRLLLLHQAARSAAPAPAVLLRPSDGALLALVVSAPMSADPRARPAPPPAAGPGAAPAKPLPKGQVGGTAWEVISVPLRDVLGLCKTKLKVDAAKILDVPRPDQDMLAEAVQTLTRTAAEKRLSARYPPEKQRPAGVPGPLLPGADLLVDPIKEGKLNEVAIVEAAYEKRDLDAALGERRCARCPRVGEHVLLAQRRSAIASRLRDIAFRLSEQNLALLPDFNQRLAVLSRLGYVDGDKAVQLKGRVACEINSADSVLVSELIFDNVLTPLTPQEVVALLSCLICQDKGAAEDANDAVLTPGLAAAKDRMYALAASLADLQTECGLQTPVDEFVRQQLNPGLIEVAYEWARGVPFKDICGLTLVPEGSIVRTIVRLEECCKEVRNAARVVGDAALYQKMEQASAAIKRDVAFASSLYVA